jgi:hypothetical protein
MSWGEISAGVLATVGHAIQRFPLYLVDQNTKESVISLNSGATPRFIVTPSQGLSGVDGSTPFPGSTRHFFCFMHSNRVNSDSVVFHSPTATGEAQ